MPGAPSQPNSELPPERVQLVAAEAADDPTGVSCSRTVDRVTFNAHILETGPASYRLRTSKTSAGCSELAEHRVSGCDQSPTPSQDCAAE